MNLLESTLNLFFPPVCGFCNQLSNRYLCSNCYDYLKKQEKNRLDVYNDKAFGEHFWIYKYDDIIRKRIIDYKFNDKSYMYRTFVELILRNNRAVEYISSFDFLVPVPIHKKRYKERGYNQSGLIAKAICRSNKKLDYRGDVLIKTKNISPQSSLNKSDREKNVLNSYMVNDKYCSKLESINGKRLLLIDDVYTTGSTLNECARTLRETFDVYIGTLTIAKD